MTQLTQTQTRNPMLALAGLAIAASMLGGIVGGVAGTRVQALVESAAIQQAQARQALAAASDAEWQRDKQASHDLAVLKAAQEWEARQRQMYPITLSVHDLAVLKAAQEWEARQRQMYPITLSVHDQAVLKAAQEWEARQRQMYPISTTAGAPDVLRAAQDRAEEYRQGHPAIK
jgi:hypothetical protein